MYLIIMPFFEKWFAANYIIHTTQPHPLKLYSFWLFCWIEMICWTITIVFDIGFGKQRNSCLTYLTEILQLEMFAHQIPAVLVTRCISEKKNKNKNKKEKNPLMTPQRKRSHTVPEALQCDAQESAGNGYIF